MEDGSLNVKGDGIEQIKPGKLCNITPENDKVSELQHIQNHVDNAVVSLVSEQRDMMELVENMNMRLSFVEAQCKANKKWCKELQQSVSENSMR